MQNMPSIMPFRSRAALTFLGARGKISFGGPSPPKNSNTRLILYTFIIFFFWGGALNPGARGKLPQCPPPSLSLWAALTPCSDGLKKRERHHTLRETSNCNYKPMQELIIYDVASDILNMRLIEEHASQTPM
jgi:hypothetical protein